MKEGKKSDGRAGILRVTQDGEVVVNGTGGLLGDEHPLDMYYAYGIRNSFGLNFDPLTGNLWETEVANHFGDEINLVEPGFNSGSEKLQGIWVENEEGNIRNIKLNDISELVDFNGKGEYSAPEFTWKEPSTPTAIKFLDSDKLGAQYQDNMFVGDFNHGYLYFFEISPDRTQLALKGALIDRVADNYELRTKTRNHRRGIWGNYRP